MVYLGSNDMNNVLGACPSEDEFAESYEAMITAILAPYQVVRGSDEHAYTQGNRAVAPPVVHLCSGATAKCGLRSSKPPGSPCDWVESIAKRLGDTYVSARDYDVPTGRCAHHRNVTQQADLARRLAPAIAEAAGYQW